MSEKVVLDRQDVRRTLVRMAHEIVERTGGRDLALVGIHRRGAVIARRLHERVADLADASVPLGDLDISFYRDDLGLRPARRQPVVHASHVDFPLDGLTVVLVDDVLYTGRTVRAAIDALFDYGRPERVQLAVLADRGHRELPIRPDYVGKNLPTGRSERVNVRVDEVDGADEVTIAQPGVGERGGEATIAGVAEGEGGDGAAAGGGERAPVGGDGAGAPAGGGPGRRS